MANTTQCQNCELYYPMQKPLPRGGFKVLKYGHCLHKTVYASNRPGNPVYPPRSKVEERPYGQHEIALVKGVDIVAGCTAVKPRKA